MADSTVNNTGSPVVLDGTENTVVETAAGVTGHATTQAIADLASPSGGIPITEDDGTNTYAVTAAAGAIETKVNVDADDDYFARLVGSANATGASVSYAASTPSKSAILNLTADEADKGEASVTVDSVKMFDLAPDALQVGPVTDGDGNVYSIEYTADTNIAVKCLTPGGAISGVYVGPGFAYVIFEPASGTTHQLLASADGFQMDGVIIDPTGGNEGDVLTQQNDGSFRPQAP